MGDTKGYPCLSWAEEGEEEEEDNEEEWRTCYTSPARRQSNGVSLSSSPAKKKLKMDSFCTPLAANCSSTSPEPSNDVLSSRYCHKRTIIHIDIDCFYAQVEMILNPSLRTKPLGIQQKHIIVTCNYVARERGLTKLMRLSDAKKKCPDLVLVNGENLSKYRDFSKRINDLLLGITPNVERLGFDENFLDVTDLVETRLSLEESSILPDGMVYGEKEIAEEKICACGCHQRLIVGSQLAAQIRKKILDDVGLTCCAGIAHNKMLAKLAGECNKPNKQTLLFPEFTNMLLGSLPARKIPGIGSSSSKRLQSMGITSVPELQTCPLDCLQSEFGDGLALTLKRFSHGIDDADVIPSGTPKSMSEEDTYHQCSSLKEVTKNLQSLANDLLTRLTEDIGNPQTIRLTIRRGIGELAGDRKESRQGPIPSNFFSSKLTNDQKLSVLLSVALELFKKLVNFRQSFNIKLLNICLTNFQKPTKSGKRAFSSFFTNLPTEMPARRACTEDYPKVRSGTEHEYDGDKAGSSITSINNLGGNSSENENSQQFISSTSENNVRDPEKLEHSYSYEGYMNSSQTLISPTDQSTSENDQKSEAERGLNSCISKEIPSDFDREVFNSLPEDVQRELIEQSQKSNHPTRNQIASENHQKSEADSVNSCTSKEIPSDVDHEVFSSLPVDVKRELIEQSQKSNHPTWSQLASENNQKSEANSFNSCTSEEVPSDVDHEVFSSLPVEVQRELIEHWKRGGKSPVKTKVEKQPTGLLKYFSKGL